MYGDAFMNRKGSNEVGAADALGRIPEGFRRVAPIGDLEKLKELPVKFTGHTMKQMDYTGYDGKRLPTPNRRQRSVITTGIGKFYGRTAYGEEFVNSSTEGSRELYKLERMRSKERKQ